MKLEPFVSTAGKVAAVSGFLQGVTWFVLSLIAVIIGLRGITFKDMPTTYTQLLGRQLYYTYLDNHGNGYQFSISHNEIKIFLWMYFVLSIGWTAISIDLFLAVVRKKLRYPICMAIWSTIACAISIIDVVLFGTVLIDYVSGCPELEYTHGYIDNLMLYSTTICHVSTGIVMTLAARGFTLWMLNVVSVIVLIKLSRKEFQKRSRFRDILRSDQFTLPKLTLQRPPQNINRSAPIISRELSRESSASSRVFLQVPPRSPRAYKY